MKKLLTVLGIMLLAVAWATSAPMAKEPQYVGVKRCAICHKKDKDGAQLPIWEKSDHAKAYKVLGTPEAAAAAKKVGVSGDPQKAEACLVCHTTGFGADAKAVNKSFDLADGVQCEACHGAGSEYRKKKVMQTIWEEHKKGGASATAKKVGLIVPDENTCKTCHAPQITFKGKTYKNPSHKPFNFKESFEKIKHPVPQK